MSRLRGWLLLIVALFVTACGSTGSDLDADASTPDRTGIAIRWRASPAVAGYIIHWGRASMQYTDALDVGSPTPDDAGVLSFVLDRLTDSGTFYFVVTSYDDAGRMSSFSNELAVTVP